MDNEETQARVAAERLAADIRSGLLLAGSKLKVSELKQRYGIGASPLREALMLVTSLGYVTGESHRGYRVAQMSEADLADITLAREIVEAGMLRESMSRRTDEWAVGIVAALERLRLTVARSPMGSIDYKNPVGEAHKQFHAALLADCPSERLASTQELLFDQAGRYRDVMIGKIRSPDDFVATHEELARIVLGPDIDLACYALREHLRLTPRDVKSSINAEAELPGRSRRRGTRSATLGMPLSAAAKGVSA